MTDVELIALEEEAKRLGRTNASLRSLQFAEALIAFREARVSLTEAWAALPAADSGEHANLAEAIAEVVRERDQVTRERDAVTGMLTIARNTLLEREPAFARTRAGLALLTHVRGCEECSGPNDGCEDGQELELAALETGWNWPVPK